MDMFMDKLAQKLNAQEIIKANSAAETEELNKMRNKIGSYEACLEKLQKLIQEGTSRIQKAGDERAEAGRDLNTIYEKIEECRVAAVNADEDSKLVLDRLATLQELEDILRGMEDHGNVNREAITEFVHKECVKVYRNVQAVIVEESEKQKKLVADISEEVEAVRSKVGVAVGFGVAASIFALAGVALQILTMLGIQLF